MLLLREYHSNSFHSDLVKLYIVTPHYLYIKRSILSERIDLPILGLLQ